MFKIGGITKKLLTQFRRKHYDENLAHLDLEISMYPYGIFYGDQTIGVCEFIDTSITTKVIHIGFIYLAPEYQEFSYMQSLMECILKKYSGYTITFHPRNVGEIELFKTFGFSYDTTYYQHESNTMKHHPWYTNIQSDKLLIAL